jgi:hypothetical protein
MRPALLVPEMNAFPDFGIILTQRHKDTKK